MYLSGFSYLIVNIEVDWTYSIDISMNFGIHLRIITSQPLMKLTFEKHQVYILSLIQNIRQGIYVE